MINVLTDAPYQAEGFGTRKIVDEKHLLIMQIALKPGQSVPQHNANSHVHLVILKGTVTVTLANVNHEVKEGDLMPVVFQTPMSIKNTGVHDATFLVIKTPNPSEMKG